MILLVLSTTAAGVYVSDKAREKVLICKELLQLCDLLALDIGYRNTPLGELISGLPFKRLGFLTIEKIKSRGKMDLPFTEDENSELALFLYSLGKSDSKSQLKLIEAFKQYVSEMKNNYYEKYVKSSKLYISFGFFFGTVISLVFI